MPGLSWGHRINLGHARSLKKYTFETGLEQPHCYGQTCERPGAVQRRCEARAERSKRLGRVWSELVRPSPLLVLIYSEAAEAIT